jgi:RecA-family ATPase
MSSSVVQLKPSYTKAELVSGLQLNESSTRKRELASVTPIRTGAPRVLPPEMYTVCRDGERTQHLTRLAGILIARGKQLDEVIALASAWNAKNNPPLEGEKLEATCSGIWDTHQRNHPDQHAADTCDRDLPLFDIEEARVSSFLKTEPPPRRWILKDCLPFGKVGALVAPGGTGKSQFLLQLAVSVATGLPFLNHWEVPKPGGVLMLAAEDDTEEIHRRLHNIATQLTVQHRDDNDLHARMKENLYVRSMVAQDNLMTRAMNGDKEIRVTSYVPRLIRTAEQVPDLRLIIVDPASRFRGGDENFAQDTTRFIEALEQVREQTGATVLVAHHTNKWSGNSDEQSQGAARGSSAFSDGVRWQMNLKPLNKTAAKERGVPEQMRRHYLEAEIVKNNYGPPSEPILLHRGDGGFLDKITIEQVGAVHKQQDLLVVRDLLRQELAKGIRHTRTSFEKCFGGESGPLKMGKVTLRSKLTKWVDSGDLIVTNKHLDPDAPMASDSGPSSGKRTRKTKT